ncbi:MAG TPA: NAD-dependent epimerase/dehydratase family protein, partial [Elusimicrobiales bacterium]|nr:NAD-dependent epimerase/dehydratase family protein [Elusimicrobiales bacterium]
EFALRRAAAGDEVSVFSRHCPVADLPKGIRQLRGDRDSRADLAALGEESWDVVLDNICFSEEQARLGMETAGRRAGLWLMVSTGDTHLAVKGALSPFTEDECASLPELPPALADSYGYGKLRAEKALLVAYHETGFPAVIIRFPIVIGPGDPKLRAYSYWLRLADGHPLIVPDGGRRYRRYIYSGDAARALELAALSPEKAAGEIFHFGDSAPLTLSEWLDISASLSGRSAQSSDIPSDWLSAQGYDFSSSPYWLAQDYVLGITKAEAIFGWRSSDNRGWLAETMRWYFESYEGPVPENYALRARENALVERWVSMGGRLRTLPLAANSGRGVLLK